MIHEMPLTAEEDDPTKPQKTPLGAERCRVFLSGPKKARQLCCKGAVRDSSSRNPANSPQGARMSDAGFWGEGSIADDWFPTPQIVDSAAMLLQALGPLAESDMSQNTLSKHLPEIALEFSNCASDKKSKLRC